MKMFSAARRRKVPDRALAWSCALMNQAATPGLGSWMGGHRLAGAGQMCCSVGGFALIMTWFFKLMTAMYSQIEGVKVDLPAIHRWGKIGAVVFLIGWLWAWVNTVQILVAMRRREKEEASAPPVIDP
jgi:hypothetical protein